MLTPGLAVYTHIYTYLTTPVRAESVAMGMRTGAFSCQFVESSVVCLRMLYTRQPTQVLKASTLPANHHLQPYMYLASSIIIIAHTCKEGGGFWVQSIPAFTASHTINCVLTMCGKGMNKISMLGCLGSPSPLKDWVGTCSQPEIEKDGRV